MWPVLGAGDKAASMPMRSSQRVQTGGDKKIPTRDLALHWGPIDYSAVSKAQKMIILSRRPSDAWS